MTMQRRRALLLQSRRDRARVRRERQLTKDLLTARQDRSTASRERDAVRQRLSEITPVYVAMKQLDNFRFGGCTYAITLTWNMDAIHRTLLHRNPFFSSRDWPSPDLAGEIRYMARDVEQKFIHAVYQETQRVLRECRIA